MNMLGFRFVLKTPEVVEIRRVSTDKYANIAQASQITLFLCVPFFRLIIRKSAEYTNFWHDARPNWAAYSSDHRAESSVASALEYVQKFMHPQVVIMDDSSVEDQWFTRPIRTKAAKHGWPVIELPVGASERLHWLARLDAQALRAFHKTRVEILVQAPQEQSGGVMRLLKSLKDADYRGLPVPKLTIELPPDMDQFFDWFISDYKWPPTSSPFQSALTSQLNVRHRVPDQILTPEEASSRFLESFYPADAEHSHVLVLNNNVELSPHYLHWVMYHVLYYKHSHPGSSFSEQVIGMSLEIPSTYLNGTSYLTPPSADQSEHLVWPGRTDPREEYTQPPFLWQAPNPNAALWFGDKWTEVHSYLRHRLRAEQENQKKQKKIVGEHLPAWTEYVLEIMQARGWSMLYPASSRNSEAMAIVHKDLWKVPEEFSIDYEKSIQRKKEEIEADHTNAPPPMDAKTPLRGIEAHWMQ